MPPAKQRTLRIPDAVWELLKEVAWASADGVTEFMVHASLDRIAASSPQLRERVEACRDEFSRRGLKPRP